MKPLAHRGRQVKRLDVLGGERLGEDGDAVRPRRTDVEEDHGPAVDRTEAAARSLARFQWLDADFDAQPAGQIRERFGQRAVVDGSIV